MSNENSTNLGGSTASVTNNDHVINIDANGAGGDKQKYNLKEFFTPFVDQGKSGSEYLIQFSQFYNLDFLPYLLAIEI